MLRVARVRHAVGSMIGRYRVDATLGAGGMGVVYRAHDTALDRDVALKVILADDATPELASRMRREARAASALTHPNAATVYDVGDVDGHPFIVMEFIEGRSLRALVNDADTSVATKLAVLRQVAEALSAAHARGLVHRDVKPDNVIVKDDGSAKLLDFGIAKRAPPLDPSAPTELPTDLTSLTQTGAVVGSPAYMSPEQLRGSNIDARSDQFSWAVMAYELLSGSLPWKGTSSAFEIAGSILHENPPRLGEVAPSLSDGVSFTIDKALSKNPERRFASMRAVIDALSKDPDPDARATEQMPPRPTPPAVAKTAGSTAMDTSRTDGAGSSKRAPPWSAIVAGLVIAVGGGLLLRSLLARDAESKGSDRGPILGLDDEATRRDQEEAQRLIPLSSSAHASPSIVPSPAASADEPAQPLPCEDKEAKNASGQQCVKKDVPWCNESGKRIACCTEGLIATSTGRCMCAPGGVKSEELVQNGCTAAPKESYAPKIQALVRKQFDTIRMCYEAALKRNAKMQGNVAVTFMIAPDGSTKRVSLAGSSAPDPDFQGCVIHVFEGFKFEPPPNGTVTVTYPVAFSPGG